MFNRYFNIYYTKVEHLGYLFGTTLYEYNYILFIDRKGERNHTVNTSTEQDEHVTGLRTTPV